MQLYSTIRERLKAGLDGVRLQTERVLLRPLMPEDAPALAVTMRDANVTDTTLIEDPARSRAEAEQRAAVRIAEFEAH